MKKVLLALALIVLIFPIKAQAAFTIYYIQVVKYAPFSGPQRQIILRNPDDVIFLTKKACEQELLKAISDPDSRAAQDNGFTNGYEVRRQRYTKTLETYLDFGKPRGLVKAQCVQKVFLDEAVQKFLKAHNQNSINKLIYSSK